MPPIKFTEVLSFSSEDPNNPADNMLRADSFRKWKCAPGSSEKQASVVLKLERLTSINSIDIGNEGAAFIEVLVSRDGASDFQVLLVASSFMTPIEARNGSDLHRVRMFGMDKLNKNVTEQKWDRVKVICTQPFNKNMQYGLSFITVRAPDQESGGGGSAPKITKLGKFTLKEEDDEDMLTAGSMFDRFKNKEQNRPSNTSMPGLGVAATHTPPKRKIDVKPPDNTFYQLKKKLIKEERPDEKTKEKKNDKTERREYKEKPEKIKEEKKNRGESSTPRPEVKVKEEKKERDERKNREASTPRGEKNWGETREKNRGETSTPKGERKVEKDEGHRRKSRPFTSLMEDVVFVLSGYQNPERSQLRDAMVEMGATYKGDWGPTCTHLICAFKNTPKYQQVHGKGRIVTAKWVTQCHKDKKRYPCRRFELEKRRTGDESEEEVWSQELLPKKPKPEVRDIPSARLSPVSPKQEPDKDMYEESTDTSDNEDTDDEIERAKARKTKDTQQSPKMKNSPRAAESPSSNSSSSSSRKRGAGDSEGSPMSKRMAKAVKTEENGGCMNGHDEHTDDEVYEDDTDVDEPPEQRPSPPDTSGLPLPSLGEYFNGKTFLVYGTLPEHQKKLLNRYITAFKGEVENYMSKKVQFVISEDSWDDNFDEALNDNPSLQFVKPSWVWRCCDKKKLLPHQPYLIVPKE